ncbi:MAG: nicotinamide mononucleotide transporter, partial [Bacteroidales bacterium]|nr:nicotinamide mononucleotide transporter [Bacteroidales bacterium]
MTFTEVIEVLALVTGLIYLFFEIIQSNWMWVVGILTGIPVAISFGMQHIWASMTLNIYYVIMSVVGIIMWINASKQTTEGAYHLVHLPKKVLIISLIATVLGIPAMILALHLTGGQETALDAVAFVLSVIGTWWLAKSYLQQWLVWIVADVISTALCVSMGSWWLAALYAAYAGWAVFGYFLWKKKGEYI